jgi:hypothetical protein
MGPKPNVEVRDWSDFGERRGNGSSYLLFRGKKVYELRTTTERDLEKLLLGSKVLRKPNLKELIWDLFFIGGPLQDRNERVLRQIERFMWEPSDAASDNRIDEFARCCRAARKIRRQFVPKGPVTLRYDDKLGIEAIFDGDGEPSGFLDRSEFQRCKREALLNGEPVPDLGDGGGKFVLYECIPATKSPVFFQRTAQSSKTTTTSSMNVCGRTQIYEDQCK